MCTVDAPERSTVLGMVTSPRAPAAAARGRPVPEPEPPPPIDRLDAELLVALSRAPRAGVMELARTLGVARGTVQARLDKLVRRGVIAGFGPVLGVRALGYQVLAFVTLDIAQGRLDDVVAHVHEIPEVLEAHAITGPGDVLCRVVARTNEDLQRVIGRILEVRGIDRTTTHIALSEQIPFDALPLVTRAAGGARPRRGR
jgi:DNA-binding Lrp family transcriptional regulator